MSSGTRHTVNLIFSDTNGIVPPNIHSHWKVIRDFERGNFAVATVHESLVNG